jgi:hypothetical protein
MENCNPMKTPFESQSNLHKRTETEEPADTKLYRRKIGSFMHFAIFTCADIAYAVYKLSQFNSNPSAIHLGTAKHLLRYIQGTKDYGLLFTTDSSSSLSCTEPHGFSDSSFTSGPDDRKSTPHIFSSS